MEAAWDYHGGYGQCTGTGRVWVDDGEQSNFYTQGSCPRCRPVTSETTIPFPDPAAIAVRLKFEMVLSRITHPDFRYDLRREGPTWFLQVVCPKGRCTRTGAPEPWSGRKWRLSEHMTDGEIAQTALMATLAAVEHEHRELFKVDGVSVFDPHYDLNALVRFRAQAEPLQERQYAGR